MIEVPIRPEGETWDEDDASGARCGCVRLRIRASLVWAGGGGGHRVGFEGGFAYVGVCLPI